MKKRKSVLFQKLPDWAFSEFTLSVLGMRESSRKWCAVGLEMDLRGYGTTFDKALADLMDHVGMQIGFAIYKNQPELIHFPADPAFFTLFAQVRAEKLRDAIKETANDSPYRAGAVNLPPPHVIGKMRDNYTPAADG